MSGLLFQTKPHYSYEWIVSQTKPHYSYEWIVSQTKPHYSYEWITPYKVKNDIKNQRPGKSAPRPGKSAPRPGKSAPRIFVNLGFQPFGMIVHSSEAYRSPTHMSKFFCHPKLFHRINRIYPYVYSYERKCPKSHLSTHMSGLFPKANHTILI